MPRGSEFPRWPIETVSILVAYPSELPLSEEAKTSISKIDEIFVGDILRYTEAELLQRYEISDRSIVEFREFLFCFDLRFGMELPGWEPGRAQSVRQLLNTRLTRENALTNLIEKNYANELSVRALNNAIKPESNITNSAARALADIHAESPQTTNARPIAAASAEDNPNDFSGWPKETVALLVAHANELPLSVRAINALSRFPYFGDVVQLPEDEALSIQNLGRKTVGEIRDFIATFFLVPGQAIPGWSSAKAEQVRRGILSQLPPHGVITNLILPPVAQSETAGGKERAKKLNEFDLWPREQLDLLIARLNELPLTPRLVNAFTNAGYTYFGEALQLSQHELLSIENLGARSVKEFALYARSHNFYCGMSIPGWSESRVRQLRAELADQEKKSILEERESELSEAQKRHESLEEELKAAVSKVESDRNREILVELWGLNNEPPKTLDAVGRRFSITRERVRQISEKAKRKINKQRLRLPFLNKAILCVSQCAPGTNDKLAKQLQLAGITKEKFSIEGLILVSKIFNKKMDVCRFPTDNSVIYAKAPLIECLPSAIHLSRKETSSYGCSNISRIASQLGLEAEESDALRKALASISEFVWLDAEGDQEWFLSAFPTRNRLQNLVLKVLHVAPKIRLMELRNAVGRSRRLGLVPPSAVLKRFCAELRLAEVTDEWIAARTQSAKTELGAVELALVRAFGELGYVLTREQLEEFCIARLGINATSFYLYLARSPLVVRLAQGIYCQVGTEVQPGEVERITKLRKSVLPPDHGWTPSGKLWLATELSRIAIHSGGLRVPNFVSAFATGEWILNSALECKIKITGDFVTGLRRPLAALGAEPGDYCLLLFEVPSRKIDLRVGGPDLLDWTATDEEAAELRAD